MRIVVVHPGASTSTSDIYDGLVPALQELGVEIVPFALDGRIRRAGGWLMYNWRRARRQHRELVRPNFADVLFLALDGLIVRAYYCRADWVLIISGMYVLANWYEYLRRAGLRTAVLLTESPYDDRQQMEVIQWADVVWTNERSSVAVLRQANPNVHYLPHAYDPARHRPDLPVPEGVPAHDVVFVGTGFEERIRLLEQVDWEGIDLGLYGNWQMLGSRNPLRRYVRGGPISNATAAALYRRARIGLNLYRTSMGCGRGVEHVTHAESLNPRALELAASQCFQLSDYRAEVVEVFGDSVPTFREAAELSRLIRYYLARPDERALLAERARHAIAGRTFQTMAWEVRRRLQEHDRRENRRESGRWHDTMAVRALST